MSGLGVTMEMPDAAQESLGDVPSGLDGHLPSSSTISSPSEARTVVVTIPGEPVAQGRGRATAFRRRDGGISARVFDPSKSRNWKAMAHEHMAAAMREAGRGNHPFDGPLSLEVFAFFGCPRSTWRKTLPRGQAWKVTRPDVDNIVKAVSDAATGVIWFDDAQVVQMTACKFVAAQGEAPRVTLIVRPLGNEADALWLLDLARQEYGSVSTAKRE